MKKHFNYIDFDKKDVGRLRREMIRQAVSKTFASLAAGMIIIIIGLHYDVPIMNNPVRNIFHLSSVILVFSLILTSVCFGWQFFMAIRSINLTKKDVLLVIEQIAPEDYHVIKTQNGGLLVQTQPVSDDDKKQSLHIIRRIELKYPYLPSELIETLKNMIKAADHDLAVEGVLRTEIIYEQLLLGNEKIIDSIEENYRGFL